MEASAGAVRLEGITKRFGGLTALDGVSLELARGEVHAIVGENGAGKSTLMKVLAGVEPPDEGRIFIGGEPARLLTPREARRRGITIVFQELNLCPHLSAAGNIFLGRERARRLGLLAKRAMVEASREVFARLGVAIDPRRRVRSLSLGEKQLVEIARALQEEAQVVILDEPNSALAEAESARLFGLLRRLRDRGTTVLYVSHRLEEVFAIADRITVLRDGRRQGTWRAAETSVPQVIAAMIGRRLEETFPRRAASPAGSPVLLEARGLERGGRFGPVTFALHEGEILGLAGLAGSGVEDVFRILFGLEAPGGGEVRVAGGPDLLRSPRQALRGGLALIPPNRRDEGLFMRWPIRKNATIAILERFRNRLGLLGRRAERRAAEELIARLRIVTEGTEKRVSSLSGGNQQKVVLAKWLAAGPRVLLLHDPTRGVDVGAKQEIYRLCDELARRGLGIVFSSSELEETIGLSDRILVFWEGRIVRELRRGEAGKAEVLHLVTGGAAAPVGP